MRRSWRPVLFVVICFLSFSPFGTHAADLVVTPVVIDEKAKPRELLKLNLTLTNMSSRKMSLYPAVNDVNRVEGEQEFAVARTGLDRAASLANWIELSRGVVELGPGEEKTIPFIIRVNLNAKPDSYHANIGFFEGSNRDEAERGSELATVAVNVEVQDDVKEELQLKNFFTDSIFFSGDDVLFKYQIENIGNRDVQPKGEIRIYDRRGKEIAAVPVNGDGKIFSPDQVSQLASVWSAAQGFGRYKAFLNVDYGNAQKASVQDTVFFWVIPWQQLLGIVVASLLALMFLTLHFHRLFEIRQRAPVGARGVRMPSVPTPHHDPATGSALSRISAVAGNVAHSYHKLKRGEREIVRTVEPVHAESLPIAQVPSVEAPPAPMPSVQQKTHATIDLKSMQPVPRERKVPAHVINLKNS